MNRSKVAVAVLLGGVGLGLLAQLVPVERTNPEVTSDVQAPAQVKQILRRACYDCHSHETKWPWYSQVAPISWRVASHVKSGRKDLNFSDWPSLDFELQDLEFEEIHDQVERNRMPPWDYVLMHPEARLNRIERRALMDWATPLSDPE